MHDVHLMTPGSRLRDRALQHLVGARPPHRDLDIVFRLERTDERGEIFLGDGGVEGQGAFPPSSGGKLRQAV